MNLNKKTLYVSDLDGTLLNNDSVLSPRTVNQLNHLIEEQDILFSIATARTPATVTRIMERVNTKLPFVVMAGAALWDNPHQSYQDVQTIDNNVVQQLLDVYEQHDIHPFVYRQHGNLIHAHHIPEMTVSEQNFIAQRLTSPLKQLFTEMPLTAQHPDRTMLVFSMGKYKRLRAIADDIEKEGISCTFMCYHDIFDEEEGYLEIYAKGTTKAAAIHRLAKSAGAQRIVVFGDNLNDIPMMKSADYSVAVENAFDEVKAQADEVIGSNSEDAVVNWIMQDQQRN